MKVIDQCCHAGQVVCVEGSGSRYNGCRQIAAATRSEREPPQLGAALLAPAAEEAFAVFGEDCDDLPLKEDTTVMVAERPYSHQAVMKAEHGVAPNVRQLWDWNVAGFGRAMG